MNDLADIPADTKDWTWVLDHPCPDCGFDADQVDLDRVAELIRADSIFWAERLTHVGVQLRPEPTVWSALEYACHVRDVHRVFDERVERMLTEDAPEFANWDQDATAVEAGYATQDPRLVTAELIEAAGSVAGRYASVRGDQWQRRGTRSNGSQFTVDSLCRYHLHDLVHHRWDVNEQRRRATVAAYDADARAYSEQHWLAPDSMRGDLTQFARRTRRGGSVLEIGSGSGHDAIALERAGLRVHRTDISQGFVDQLTARGFEAQQLDPLVDDLGGPWDGVWMSAVLHHLDRREVPVLLERLHQATVTDGSLYVRTKEGEGAGWSTHGSITSPRHFTYWREPALRSVLERAGWLVEDCYYRVAENEQPWLDVFCVRA